MTVKNILRKLLTYSYSGLGTAAVSTPRKPESDTESGSSLSSINIQKHPLVPLSTVTGGRLKSELMRFQARTSGAARATALFLST